MKPELRPEAPYPTRYSSSRMMRASGASSASRRAAARPVTPAQPRPSRRPGVPSGAWPAWLQAEWHTIRTPGHVGTCSWLGTGVGVGVGMSLRPMALLPEVAQARIRDFEHLLMLYAAQPRHSEPCLSWRCLHVCRTPLRWGSGSVYPKCRYTQLLAGQVTVHLGLGAALAAAQEQDAGLRLAGSISLK